MAKPTGFDKDIGYLMPFLERVAAAADELRDAGAREELKRLMGEEKARWARIQELLGGAPGRGVPAAAPGKAPAVSPRTSSTVPELARAHADEINRAQPRQVGLTVGSLKRRS